MVGTADGTAGRGLYVGSITNLGGLAVSNDTVLRGTRSGEISMKLDMTSRRFTPRQMPAKHAALVDRPRLRLPDQLKVVLSA